MKRIGKRVAVAAVAVGAVLLAGCSSDGGDGGEGTRVLRMATPGAEQSVQGQSMIAWAEEVNEATNGSIEIEIYPSGSLLAGTDILPGVADGRADLGMSYTNYHATDLPYWGVVAYPFVTNSWHVHAAAFAQLREEFPEVDAAFEEFGVRPVATMTNGAASSAGHSEITSVSELDGRRYRAPGLMSPIMGTIGVDPVFMELSESYEALQRGVLDGFVGIDIGVATGFKLEEVTPYFSDLGIGMYAASTVFINDDVWASLTPEQQEAISSIDQEYPERLIPLVTELETAACDQVIAAGGSVTPIEHDAAYDKWQAAATDAAAETLIANATANGIDADDYQAFIDRYIELAEQFEQEIGGDYTDGFQACAAR